MSLQKHRKCIDCIDNKIINLLERRQQHCKSIGDIKKDQKLNILSFDRENKILNRLKNHSKNLKNWEIDLVYNSIFRISKSIQQ